MNNIPNKLVFLSLILMLSAINKNSVLHAQPFEQGTVVFNAGVGVFSSIRYDQGTGVKRSPVLWLSGEYQVTELGPGPLGVGSSFDYQSASHTDHLGSYFYQDNWTTKVLGVRGTYHPDILSDNNYDLYGALQLSFNWIDYKFTSDDPSYTRSVSNYYRNIENYASVNLILGGRCYFTENIGAFGEIGYDISYLKLGLVFKY